MTAKPGTLFVAHQDLQEYAYDRSVQLIVKNDAEGTIALNVTGGMLSEEIGYGGPENWDTIYFLHKVTNANPEGAAVGDTGYATTEIAKSNQALIEKLATCLKTPAIVEQIGPGIMLIGYTEWKPGDFERQVEQGFWIETKVPLDALMRVPVQQRWETAGAHTEELPAATPQQAALSAGKRFSL